MPKHTTQPIESSVALKALDAASSHEGAVGTEVITKYQHDLDQKDELITALVKELEQAVEQLDRIERTGADRSRGNRSSMSANPFADLHDGRSPFMDDLRQMAADWEETQAGSLLVRIDSQLASLCDLVKNQPRGHRTASEPNDFEERIRRLNLPPETNSDQHTDSVNMTLDESSPCWQTIKSQILDGEFIAAPEPVEMTDDREILKLMTETPTPVDVDFQSASHDDLKAAILERDTYIIQLNRLFRTRNVLALPNDWAALGNVPADLQLRVESIMEHLDVQVRLGEVEMSLERARLARERSQIQSDRETIEKHMKRLGLTSLSELENISAATGSITDRRWLRFLGPNTK
ncbi:hypothetical protein [Schlesneria paludicola]|uniref:hypothetical protein n=1 Tax=Schlesneria paludicola TaxID=360056 RepID=UPI0012F96CE4|nr:hypothetical protein [Schlesneria paludicola]